MASTKISNNISFSNGVLTVFGKMYWKSETGSWSVPTDFGVNALVSPEGNNFKDVQDWLTSDQKNGCLDKVNHIRISSRRFGLAFLEGLIPVSTIKSARADADYIEVELHFLDKNYPVRVYNEEQQILEGSYDENGEVV